MAGISVNTRLICIASIFLAAASAQTHGWTSPVVLSTGGQGWEATAAIDGGGNSVALWDERTTMDQLWSRAKPSGGTWGSVTEVSPALQTTSVLAGRASHDDRIRHRGMERSGRRVDSRSPACVKLESGSASDSGRVKSALRNGFAGRCRDSLERRGCEEFEQFRYGCVTAGRKELDGSAVGR